LNPLDEEGWAALGYCYAQFAEEALKWNAENLSEKSRDIAKNQRVRDDFIDKYWREYSQIDGLFIYL